MEIEKGKKEFLGERERKESPEKGPISSAVVVGVSYFVGAMVPVLPVLFGATTAFASIIAGVAVAAIVSYIIAILSGMRVVKRIITNVIVIAIAVTVTYGIGIGAREILGLDL
jgi:VIT1/CCC1 family predicted Fe2+/Mn2+ transporter